MTYTNSPLVDYTRISPYRGSRNGHVIDTITIHCAAAQAAVETLGKRQKLVHVQQRQRRARRDHRGCV